MMIQLSRFCALATLLLTVGAQVAMADGAPQAPTEPLSITATGDPMNRVGQPVFVEFSIKNITNGDLILKDLTIELDAMVRDSFDPATASCNLDQRGEVLLHQGAALLKGCRFQPKRWESLTAWREWAERLFAADIRYVVVANVETVGDLRYYPSITIKANETSVFLGGFAGALLLAIFVWVQKLISEPKARQAWGVNLGYTLLLGIRGAIMAAIALLIGKTTQGAGSPVALTVVDFSGGLMIGIFSYPLASWMADTLKIRGVSGPAKAEHEEVAVRERKSG